ncbi:MAG: SMC-Scp complex subunit ScpB [Gammaproteobacteria bacterium]|nr:SMC-Scp complex subunit ScpB [Gammaproteobacteria bacterium]
MSPELLKKIVEAALFAYGKPMTVDMLLKLFAEEELPSREQIQDVLAQLQQEWQGRGTELVQVASGYRFQAAVEVTPWVARLWEEKPAKYSRAILETMALIAYRQPITRSEIEEIRGVSVSSQIVKTLLEREWVRVVGTKDVPGRPALYATTRQFLDYFNFRSLEELPPLAEIRDLDVIAQEFDMDQDDKVEAALRELRDDNDEVNLPLDEEVEFADEHPVARSIDEPEANEPESSLVDAALKEWLVDDDEPTTVPEEEH